MLRAVRLFVGVFVVVLAVAITYSTYEFPHRENKLFYDGCKKVWAHRGDASRHVENSVGSFTAAFDEGAPGVELDIHYDSQRRTFVVTHDDPVPNAPELLLEEVLDAVGSRGGFWLDYKNLKKLGFGEARESAAILARLLDKYGARRNAIVESVDPVNLFFVSRAGVATSLWVSPPGDDEPVRQWIDLARVRMNMVFGGFSAVSMAYRHYRGKVQTELASAPVHLFTANEAGLVDALARERNVHIVLSDKPPYDLTWCRDSPHVQAGVR